MSNITHSSTTPSSGDNVPVLLSKLLQLFGGSPASGDGTPELLRKVLLAGLAAQGGAAGALNFVDNGDEAEVLRNAGTERVLITNVSKHLILNSPRISRDVDDSAFAFVGASSKERGSFIEFSGQDHPVTPGNIGFHYKNGGKVRFKSYPDDSLIGVEHLTLLGGGMVKQSLETLTYAASVALDFETQVYKKVDLTGNITFTTSNLAVGASMAIKIAADGSIRTFTFPAGWTFIGSAAPADIAANKTGVLSLTSFGTTDAEVIAAYAVEP
jgi:hypothetical protein